MREGRLSVECEDDKADATGDDQRASESEALVAALHREVTWLAWGAGLQPMQPTGFLACYSLVGV